MAGKIKYTRKLLQESQYIDRVPIKKIQEYAKENIL